MDGMKLEQYHREYVRQKVREIYPNADLDNDYFLILQCMIQTVDEIPKAISRKAEAEKETLNCLIYVYEKEIIPKTNPPVNWRAVYPAITYPYPQRTQALAGVRYNADDVSADNDTYDKHLLKIEQWKEVCDLGVVLRFRSLAELKRTNRIDVIWDCTGYGTVTMIHNIKFCSPSKARENCYHLVSYVPGQDGWIQDQEIPKEKRTGVLYNYKRQHIKLSEEKSIEQPHHIYRDKKTLIASVLGENIDIASQSNKFKKWVKAQNEKENHEIMIDKEKRRQKNEK